LQAQEAIEIERDGQYLCVTTSSDQHQIGAEAVLLATGAHYRKLEVPGEDDLIGINVHFCATCDGAFYRGKRVLVIGGGNSGFEESLFLTKFAAQVDILVKGPQPRASKVLQDKVAGMENMQVYLNQTVREFVGKNKLEGIFVEDRASGAQKRLEYDGVFVFIGVSPNNELVKDKVELDAAGFIKTDFMRTSMRGVFAAGDVRSGSTKQAASATGEGATAALAIREYLKSLGE
jgi:thioredoxin reductase (NADPH)